MKFGHSVHIMDLNLQLKFVHKVITSSQGYDVITFHTQSRTPVAFNGFNFLAPQTQSPYGDKVDRFIFSMYSNLSLWKRFLKFLVILATLFLHLERRPMRGNVPSGILSPFYILSNESIFYNNCYMILTYFRRPTFCLAFDWFERRQKIDRKSAV